MSERSPHVYEFIPDLLPPVFEGAPLPVREFQIHTLINDSLFMRSDTVPETLSVAKESSIEDVVRELEGRDEPVDVKDGRLLGLVAAMTEDSLTRSTTLDKWQLAPHLAMLNAVSAALSAGLFVSDEALRMGAVFHREYSGRDTGPPDISYVSPGVEPVVQEIKRTMSNYGSMDLIRNVRGIGRYLSYYLYDIDSKLHDLPVPLEALAAYENDANAMPLVGAYNCLTTQIAATRNELMEREAELNEHLERVYERITKAEATR